MARTFNADGTNRLEVGDVPAVDFTGDYLTLFAWCRPAASGNNAIIAKRDTTDFAYELRFQSGVVYFLIGDGVGGFDDILGATAVPLNRWHAIAGVKDGVTGNSQRVYLDGILDKEESSTKTIGGGAQSFKIGVWSDNTNFPFNGPIAHVAIWNAGLTYREIQLLSSGVSPLRIRPGNLRGYWPLDDYGASGQAKDLSVFANHATMAGTVGIEPFPYVSRFATVVAGTEIGTYQDAAEVYVDIQVSGVEEQVAGAGITAVQPAHGVPTLKRPHSRARMRLPEVAPPELFEALVDVATIYVDIQITSVELRESIDAATIYIDITNTGGECYTSFTSEFLGEGEAFLEFFAEFDELEWSSSNDFLEWSPGVPVVEEEHC